MKNVRIRLAELAKKLGKTAIEIAADTNINRNTINGLISGKKQDVRVSTILKISERYNIPFQDLFIEQNDPQSQSLNFQAEVKSKSRSGKIYKQEGEITPFTCWPFILTAEQEKIEFEGSSARLGSINCYFKGDYGYLYFQEQSLREYAYLFYKKHQSINSLSVVINKFEVYCAQIRNFYLELYQAPLNSFNEDQIIELFSNLTKVYHEFWKSSLFIEAFDSGIDQEIIASISGKYKFLPEQLQQLVHPLCLSFNDRRLLELYTIIENFSSGASEPPDSKINTFINRNTTEIELYRRNFNYYKSNYTFISSITNEEIVREIKNYFAHSSKCKQKLSQLSDYEQNKKEEQLKILKDYGLTNNPFQFFQEIYKMRDVRTQYNLMGIHALNFILDWLVQKTGIDKVYLRYLAFDEVSIILRGLIKPEFLKERYDKGVLISSKNQAFRLIFGDEAKAIKKHFEAGLNTQRNQQDKVLQGVLASPGYAKGRARVVLTQKDLIELRKGEIIVTSMIRPEYMEYLNLAAGIVMVEGGLTSPGPLEARKLGIPCLVSVKKALKKIENGSLLEILASQGTVNLI